MYEYTHQFLELCIEAYQDLLFHPQEENMTEVLEMIGEKWNGVD